MRKTGVPSVLENAIELFVRLRLTMGKSAAAAASAAKLESRFEVVLSLSI